MSDEIPLAPTHVMLDLETWGTGNDAVPISIGACRFTSDEIIDTFHVAIDPGTAKALGLDVDCGTILWWMDSERREALDRWLKMEKIDLASALAGFSDWVSARQPVAIWGNGSTFDNVILRSAYAAAGLEYPVRFWQDYCYRTMKQQTDVAIVREGTHHDALDDAISQVKHLQAIWRRQDDSELRAMLERNEHQFRFYAQNHREKADPKSPKFVGFTLQSETLEKAEVNESVANEIRRLLDGGPYEA